MIILKLCSGGKGWDGFTASVRSGYRKDVMGWEEKSKKKRIIV